MKETVYFEQQATENVFHVKLFKDDAGLNIIQNGIKYGVDTAFYDASKTEFIQSPHPDILCAMIRACPGRNYSSFYNLFFIQKGREKEFINGIKKYKLEEK